MTSIFQDTTRVVGCTPLIRLNRIADGVGASILAKLEFQNPLGSVKDRVGLESVDAVGNLKVSPCDESLTETETKIEPLLP